MSDNLTRLLDAYGVTPKGDTAPSAQSAVAPTLAEVARAAEHFRYCSNAGETTEFRCSLCVAASNVVAAALESPHVPTVEGSHAP